VAAWRKKAVKNRSRLISEVHVARIKDLKTATKINLLLATTIAGFLLVSWLGYSTLSQVKVGGPVYSNISLGKALDSDVVPPSLYLGEEHMQIRALLAERDRTKAQSLIDDYKLNVKDFRDTHDRYEKDLPEGPVKQLFRGDAYTQAVGWLNVIDQQVLPAKLAGDDKLATEAFEKAESQFEAHRKANRELAAAVEGDSKKLEEAATSSISHRTLWLGLIMLGVCGTVVGLGVYTSRAITGSMQKTVDVLRYTADGDLRKRVDVDTKDEAGQMGDALNHTLDRISDAIREIGAAASQLTIASDEFSNTSQQITANSEETSTQARVVSTATEQVSQNLQTVASGSNQMAITVKDIAQNAQEAAKVAAKAQRTAEETNHIVSKLGESSAQIGKVIKVITSIAQKTDLLALNATVEAARAGEVGAGFAVVANEVKELAKQTAQATEEISQKIEAIQTDAKSAVEAIANISGVINKVNEISMSIATAVEEQSATTTEMSQNTVQAAHGAEDVAHNIAGVAQAAEDTAKGASQSQKASKELSRMSGRLRELVGQFRVDGQTSSNRKNWQSPPATPSNSEEPEPVEELVGVR
jgi:methyl-accepting chemotaxis protein